MLAVKTTRLQLHVLLCETNNQEVFLCVNQLLNSFCSLLHTRDISYLSQHQRRTAARLKWLRRGEDLITTYNLYLVGVAQY